ncbi:MAG: hypothetical protein ACREMT_12270, partial [Vulcanimicrobiaceae bacterium]
EPKRRRIFETAIAISIVLHLFLGGFFAYRYQQVSKMLERVVKLPKKQQIAALSTAVTIEKRTRPRVVPPSPPQPQPVPPQPQVRPHVAKVEQPKPKPVEPAAKPTEIARIVPRAPPLPRAAHIRAPHANPSQQMTQSQLEEMERQFARTIAMARAANDPTRVPQQAGPPSTMKKAHIDIAGVNELLRHGEGILTPREAFRASVDGDRKGTCYYVDYEINFSNGKFDSGPVYWPICYPRKADPFINEWRGFPLPGPQPGWQPTDAQWSVISVHPLLRLYFPARFPDENNN